MIDKKGNYIFYITVITVTKWHMGEGEDKNMPRGHYFNDP